MLTAKMIRKNGTSQMLAFFLLAVCDWLPAYNNISFKEHGKFCPHCSNAIDSSMHFLECSGLGAEERMENISSTIFNQGWLPKLFKVKTLNMTCPVEGLVRLAVGKIEAWNLQISLTKIAELAWRFFYTNYRLKGTEGNIFLKVLNDAIARRQCYCQVERFGKHKCI